MPTEGSSKQPITFNSLCGKPIYSISWQDKFLYVVCNERIAVYEDDPNKKGTCLHYFCVSLLHLTLE